MSAALRLAMVLAAVPALSTAEPWRCTMTVRCENIDCVTIDDTYRLIAADHAGDLFLTSPAGVRPVTRLSPPGMRPAAYASAGLHTIGELLTITADGQAILSIHRSDGRTRTTTIFGICTGF